MRPEPLDTLATLEAMEDRVLFSGIGSEVPAAPVGDVSAAAAAPVAAAPARPNFLFVITDDLRHDALGFVQKAQGDAGRFPWLLTPNLDQLRSQSVWVRNAFVTSSVCSPSRAGFLTGMYNHKNGVKGNFTPFPTGNTTYASLLRQAGYDTGYVGKWHMGLQAGQRPGFSYSASYVGQGKFFDNVYEINGSPTQTTGWVDDVTTNYAVNYINSHAAGTPFVLAVGYKSPHTPHTPPTRLAGALSNVTPDPAENTQALPPYGPQGSVSSLAEQRNYFRTVLGIDENVGRLMSALNAKGLANNTVVVFTSDNGFHFGEHGVGDKRLSYEESIRVPMLVRYPNLVQGGGTLSQMVLNIDIAPTFLDLAGVAVPASMDGRSIKPLLTGQTGGWRTDFMHQYFEDDGYPAPYYPPENYAVRTESAKLVKWAGKPQWTQLFDLAADPYEKNNLYNKPAGAALQQAMTARYDTVATRIGFSPTYPPAGSVFKVNFQPATAPAVPDYAIDAGQLYAARNGQSYGWSVSHTGSVFDRQATVNQLLDTGVAVKASAKWEMAVPNGTYTVKVGIGDASSASTNTVYVEGKALFVRQALRSSQYNVLPATVNVSDGKLTLTFGSSTTTRLVYLTVAGLPVAPQPASFKVNFQPSAAPGVSGYLIDAGLTYGARNGRTYGWSVSHADAVVDRNVNGNQLLDTNVGVKAAAKWELAVPNGTYTVKVGVGDAGASSRNNVWIEGVQLFDYVTLAANAFSSKLITVNVTDGKLTMGVGGAATGQTRINFLEVA